MDGTSGGRQCISSAWNSSHSTSILYRMMPQCFHVTPVAEISLKPSQRAVGHFRKAESGYILASAEETVLSNKLTVSFPSQFRFQTALLLDISHSTALVHSDMETASLAFVKALRADHETMVVAFTNKVFVDSEFTNDHNQLLNAVRKSQKHVVGTPYLGEDIIKRINDPTRRMGTRLYDAIDMTITDRLKKVSGRKAIVIFTDGIDTGSRIASASSTLARIEESDVLVYTIHYDTPVQKLANRNALAGMIAAHGRGAEYLQRLADQSGGRFFKASTQAGFQEAFSSITEEMGHQYTLCYYPTSPLNDTSFRKIQVTVDKPGTKVRARAGYRPSPNASADGK